MNRHSTENLLNRNKIARFLSLCLLAGVLAATPPESLHGADSKPIPAKAADLSKQLVGTWVYLGKPGETVEPPAAGGRFKTMQHGLYRVTQKDPSGADIYHHGGTYTLEGDQYAEKCEYSSDPKSDLIKQVFRFTIKIEGDLLTQTGVGNPWTEVWRRVK